MDDKINFHYPTELSHENSDKKYYLRNIFQILQLEERSLDLAGMNLERSRLGRIKARAAETVEFIINDNDFIGNYEIIDPDYYFEFLHSIEIDLTKGIIQPPAVLDFTILQKDLLTKVTVL